MIKLFSYLVALIRYQQYFIYRLMIITNTTTLIDFVVVIIYYFYLRKYTFIYDYFIKTDGDKKKTFYRTMFIVDELVSIDSGLRIPHTHKLSKFKIAR